MTSHRSIGARLAAGLTGVIALAVGVLTLMSLVSDGWTWWAAAVALSSLTGAAEFLYFALSRKGGFWPGPFF